MADLHTRLTDTLREAAVDRTSTVIDRQVDALLSSPSIAIVELPEGQNLDLGITTYGNEKAMTADRFPGMVGRPGSPHWISPDKARAQAAALLAAAKEADRCTETQVVRVEPV